MTKAKGIHAHPSYKTGKRPPKQAPAIRFSAIRSGAAVTAPVVPSAVDDTAGVTFGLDNNDRFGVCVPTGFDNFRRMVTKLLTGTQESADWDQIVKWYKEQNPKFNPDAEPDASGEIPGDGGMDIQTFLEARVKAGDIIAFASVDQDNEDEVREAVYLFLGIILGVDLQTAQQSQTDQQPPVWDYKRSGEWGGHCVMEPAFLANGNEEVVSWDIIVQMTQKFIKSQRDEAWVVVTQHHLDNPTFREGIDVTALASEYERLTGRQFPDVKPEPTPIPAPPTPPTNDEVDAALWTLTGEWTLNHDHSGKAKTVAKALKAWAVAKGLTP